MSSAQSAPTTTFRWRDGLLQRVSDTAGASAPLASAPLASDSFLVEDGRVLALDLHRSRFLAAVAAVRPAGARSGTTQDEGAVFAVGSGAAPSIGEGAAFWDTVVAALPRTGDWFPRVDLVDELGTPSFRYLERPAPGRARSVVLRTHDGPDPRTTPRIKGPDLAVLHRVREAAAARGAGDVVIRSPGGFVVEGGYSALVWWRGESLCLPVPELERIDSVTANVVVTIATALGTDVLWEETEPHDLDGLEVWCLNSLHGIRIVTEWIDGPGVAEMPGRLAAWRSRLGRLSRPLATLRE